MCSGSSNTRIARSISSALGGSRSAPASSMRFLMAESVPPRSDHRPKRCGRRLDEHAVTSPTARWGQLDRSEEHTSELQSLRHLVCRLLLEKKQKETDGTKRKDCALTPMPAHSIKSVT